MPPRISTSLQACAELASSAAAASPLEHALLACRALPSASASASSSRGFSTSSVRQRRLPTHPKSIYQRWLKGDGRKFEYHTPNETNYIGPSAKGLPRPFPSNPAFVSQPVLSEEARELIYQRVFTNNEPIKVVSADLGVDHRRVAAVVRMKEVEKEWERQNVPLARNYSRAILEMVPKHSFPQNKPAHPFEPINEIHVHGYTMQQLFVPTSESREFTREDAAKAFHHTMLSADDRIPHKELVEHYRRIKDGMTPKESRNKFVKETRRSQEADEAREASVGEWDKKLTTAITTDRFEFRFKKMTVDDVGRDGRSRRGVGWRYGIPFEDRKKNQIKIPTKIE